MSFRPIQMNRCARCTILHLHRMRPSERPSGFMHRGPYTSRQARSTARPPKLRNLRRAAARQHCSRPSYTHISLARRPPGTERCCAYFLCPSPHVPSPTSKAASDQLEPLQVWCPRSPACDLLVTGIACAHSLRTGTSPLSVVAQIQICSRACWGAP
ncbi:hypothetical protein PENSPDRAFT_205817 [Peniophora sp. CONT]|nr:hypothetical protein PENSPDRAFT_205817 [Peniophora sp. CONT]